MGGNGSVKCATNVHLVETAKSKLARTECVGHPTTALGQHARPQYHLLAQTGSYVWCCRCGGRAAKFAKKLGEPCVGHPRSQEYARSIRLLSSGWHPKENRCLGSPKLFSRSKNGQGGGRATKGTTATGLGWAGMAELRQAAIRLRTAEAQPTNPDDKKHLLLKTGEIKWCWRCGARVERDSAPRLLLKTACSGAPRTKEYERALSLFGKGQHPKSSGFIGSPSPISDEEWDQWHQNPSNLFFCLRELSSS